MSSILVMKLSICRLGPQDREKKVAKSRRFMDCFRDIYWQNYRVFPSQTTDYLTEAAIQIILASK